MPSTICAIIITSVVCLTVIIVTGMIFHFSKKNQKESKVKICHYSNDEHHNHSEIIVDFNLKDLNKWNNNLDNFIKACVKDDQNKGQQKGGFDDNEQR